MKCDCIIPFYNEGERVLYVVEMILKSKVISTVIVVDDGSKDKNTYAELVSKYPKAKILRLEQNRGKSDAIREGLKYTDADYVLLFDGDLSNIIISEIDTSVNKVLDDSRIDLVIFRRSKDPSGTGWLRWDIVMSGQRIIKRNDLDIILKQKVKGYQLEVATNTYMMKNHKKVYWAHSSVTNLYKSQKWGFIEGMRVGVPGLISYAGWGDTIKQTLFFCRKELQ